MAINVQVAGEEEELSVGSGLNPESRFFRRRYQILGTDSAGDALLALAGAIPLTREFQLPVALADGTIGTQNVILYRQPLTVRRLGFGVHESDVVWNLKSNSEFDVTERGRSTGGTQKILGSFFTTGHSDNAPDFGGLIAYNPKDQSVEGCEIVVPNSETEIEVIYPAGYVSDGYLAALDDLTGCVNSVAWRRWSAGQVLYKGAEYSKGISDPTRVVHYIGVQRSIANTTIAGLKGINKEGWDFLWFLTEEQIVNVQGNDVPVKKAKHWYSERVLPRVDFKAVLGF